MPNDTIVPYQMQPETERNEKVRRLYSSGDYSYNKLSRIFKVSPQRIQQIVKNKPKENPSATNTEV